MRIHNTTEEELEEEELEEEELLEILLPLSANILNTFPISIFSLWSYHT